MHWEYWVIRRRGSMPEVKMPQLGETVVEGTITKWLKNEGEMVEEDDLLVEISTDKVDSEVPSSESGKLTKILVQEGETVSVGTALAVIGEEGEAAAEEEAPEEEPAAEAEAPPKEEEREAPKEEAKKEREPERKPEPEPAAVGAGPRPAPTAAEERPRIPGDVSKRGIISPLVRRLAEEHDVDLEEVEGSGTGGRIRKQDVLRFIEERKGRPKEEERRPAAAAAQPEAAPAAAREPGAREELVPWTNIRRRTAEHMVASSRTVARAWNAVEVDWTNVVRLRDQAKDNFRQQEGVGLTYMAFLAKVVCDTLREMPEINATFDEENQANLVKHYVNLGIAVALEGGGLIVPVIKGADGMNVPGLARAITDVASRARNKKLSPDDLTGGTFTITNPGPFGSKISVPIIPQNQTAILAFEAIDKQVVVTDDEHLAIRSMGFLPLSWDHRVIDGAEAARFLARLKERIETTDFSADLARYL
jgi:pyruvate dehydrogenase E2 component (dihydrolipoamide acetyltransferase)